MKPLNLREYAEALALGPDREFATEILENLDFADTYPRYEIEHELRIASEKEFEEHEPLKQIGRIIDRLNVLDEILDTLNTNKLDGDPDDVVRGLAELSLALRNVLGLDPDGDIFEAVAQLVDNKPKPMEYDL